jgi:CheY-like chemotaxis protein
LALVKRLVEMHGGAIEAKSDGPGLGSQFIIRLPIVVPGTQKQTIEIDEDRAGQSVFRILIVDDNRDGANSLSLMLKIMGNETKTAYDGQEGVEIASAFLPDIVLMDIGLPKLNGYEACRAIRRTSWGKKVFMIALTGWGQDEDRRRSQEAGFDRHFVKPVDSAALAKLLGELSANSMKRPLD